MNLLEASAAVFRPLIEYFKHSVIDSGILGVDETRTTLLLPQNIPPPIEGDQKSQRIYEVFQEAVQQKKPSVSGHMWA